jgi:hypothetical protein
VVIVELKALVLLTAAVRVREVVVGVFPPMVVAS